MFCEISQNKVVIQIMYGFFSSRTHDKSGSQSAIFQNSSNGSSFIYEAFFLPSWTWIGACKNINYRRDEIYQFINQICFLKVTTKKFSTEDINNENTCHLPENFADLVFNLEMDLESDNFEVATVRKLMELYAVINKL